MASINQLVSEIAHSVQGADNIPTRRGIRLAIIHARNQLIRHSYEEHGYVDRVIQQRFRVALIDVPDGDVDIAGASIDAKDYKETVGTIKRTKNKVPRPTRLSNNLPFSAVKTTGVRNPISIPFVREASSQFYNSLPGFCPNVTYDYINDYIYINVINEDSLQDIDSIVIEAPFEKPEIVEMEAHAQDHDDAQHQHVLAGPLYGLGLVSDSITIVATSLTVLQGEPEGIHEMQGHQRGQAEGCHHGIPVGAQKLANHVVTLRTDESHNVH